MLEIKTLRLVAKEARTLLERYTPVNKNPNAKTRGNLKAKMLSYNSVNKIIGKSRQTTKGNITTAFNQLLTIKYAPPGAEYGKFVEEGTRYIQPPRKFAEKSLTEAVKLNSKRIADELAKYVASQMQASFRGI